MARRQVTAPVRERPTAAEFPAPSRSRAAKRASWLRQAAVLAVVTAVVSAGIIFGIAPHLGSSTSAGAGSQSGPTVYQLVSRLDPAVVRTVGSGGLADPLKPVSGAAPLLDSRQKPLLIFVGAGPCDACAALRWSVVVAVSRFGSFDYLPLMAMPAHGSSPQVASFSFFGAGYRSDLISFAGVETSNTAGKSLQPLSATGQQLLDALDVPPYVPQASAGALPWLDIGNRYVMQGSGYPQDVISGLPWTEVGKRLSRAADPVAQGIIGTANYLTAAICKTTSMQPASVCDVAPISSMASQLP